MTTKLEILLFELICELKKCVVKIEKSQKWQYLEVSIDLETKRFKMGFCNENLWDFSGEIPNCYLVGKIISDEIGNSI